MSLQIEFFKFYLGSKKIAIHIQSRRGCSEDVHDLSTKKETKKKRARLQKENGFSRWKKRS